MAPTFSRDPGLQTTLLPGFRFSPCAFALFLELLVALRQLLDRLLGKELLERPLLDVLRLVVFNFLDVLYGALEDGALVLLATGNDLCEFVDTFVDGFAASTFDCGGVWLAHDFL